MHFISQWGSVLCLGAGLESDGFTQTVPSRHFEFSLFWRLAKERFFSQNSVKCMTELI